MIVIANILFSIVIVAVLMVGIIVALGWLASTPAYRGPVSDHFDGRRFRNYHATPHNDFREAAKWAANRQRGYWKPRRDEPPGPAPPTRVEGEQLRVTFVNHTTVLIQTHGLNILTDPIWSERCGPVSWFGPRRVRPPGIRFGDLPPIDLVLLSHNHYDHCDLPTLRLLARDHKPNVIVPLGNRDFLERRRVPVLNELDWWHSVGFAGLTITSVPVRHFAGRGLFDRDRSLWCGYVIETPSGSICFAADTGWGKQFEEIKHRFGAPRLALLPIAAFRPEWFMSRVHMSPEQALEAHTVLGAKTSVGTHYGTFPLADDGETEATERIVDNLHRVPEGTHFWVLGFGEGQDVP
jgi:L-ascorbate metabolism protein UlaG (beta-lactamase superfamily)